MASFSETSSLSPPPSTLSSLSPPPGSTPSTPTPDRTTTTTTKKARSKKPKGPVNGTDKTKPPTKRKKKDVEAKQPTMIKIKLKPPKGEHPKDAKSKDRKTSEDGEGKVKKIKKKPREPKLDPVPRSVVNNHDVPLVVLFRSKFRSLFSGTSELGPQDVEEGCLLPDQLGDKLTEFVLRICALIGNRRKTAEHDQLEKVVQETADSCFEKIGFKRDGAPYHPFRNVTLATLDWDARLHLLRALVHWALATSDAVRQLIDEAYKLAPTARADRADLDLSLGVQPLYTLKTDRFFLVEGRDTRFRLYKETNPHWKVVNITSEAEDKPSLLAFVARLEEGGKLEREFARLLKEGVISRIEAAEIRRVKAEQAALRLAMWKAAPPVYNTRTRGKKVNYSELDGESEEEEDIHDEDVMEEERRGIAGSRRSERNRGGGGDREVVEYTGSGRVVKRPRLNGVQEEQEEEMEWSEYSDKGVTDGSDDEMDVEEQDDVEPRSMVLKLKVPRDKLAIAATTRDSLSANGVETNSWTTSPRKNAPSPSSSRSASQHYPPKPFPPSAPTPDGYVPFIKDPATVPFRSTQLSPQPIPRPTPVFSSPPQGHAFPLQSQVSPKSFFQPQHSPKLVQQQTSPRPYQPQIQSFQPQPFQPRPYGQPQYSPRPYQPQFPHLQAEIVVKGWRQQDHQPQSPYQTPPIQSLINGADTRGNVDRGLQFNRPPTPLSPQHLPPKAPGDPFAKTNGSQEWTAPEVLASGNVASNDTGTNDKMPLGLILRENDSAVGLTDPKVDHVAGKEEPVNEQIG